MKRYSNWVEGLLCLMLVMATSACGLVSSYDTPPYRHIFIEEEAHLTDDASSPFCDFSVDYTYLNEEGDSIAQLINRAIQREFLGEAFAHSVPEVAVDSFKNDYLRTFREETGGLYQTDLDKHGADSNIPQWYNQTYSLVTFVEEGQAGTVIASANYFVDMGGAHPNQWSRWMNFDFETGQLLTPEVVFLPSAKEDIERMLFDKLLLHVGGQYPDETLSTLDDLQQKGYLQLTNIYIPDNFLLRKEGISFLYNRYDIAPYAAGEIVIDVPYGEIGHCLSIFK